MKLRLYAKCSDMCSVTLINDTGTILKEHDGYVPQIVGPDSDGVDFTIDVQTGRILNWKIPTEDQLKEFIGGSEGEETNDNEAYCSECDTFYNANSGSHVCA